MVIQDVRQFTGIGLRLLLSMMFVGLPALNAQQGAQREEEPPSEPTDHPEQPAPTEDLIDQFIQVSDEGLLSLNMQGAKLHAVLSGLVRKTQRNIIFDEMAAQQRVYVRLYNLTLEETLNAILKKYGYGYREEGNILYIYPQSELDQIEAAERRMATRHYRLNYITPADATILLAPFLSESGTITMTPEAQTGVERDSGGQSYAAEDLIVVQDYEDNQRLIEENLPLIDKRPKQVLVEATILRATLNETNALGIDFNAVCGIDFQAVAGAPPPLYMNGPNAAVGVGTGGVAGGTTGAGGSGGATQLPASGSSDFLGLTNAVPYGKLNDLTFGSSTDFAGAVPTGGLSLGVVSDNVSIFIRALEAVTDVTVLANPKLLTLNKQVGNFLVGARDGYLTTTVTETSATQAVSFLETGTQLRFRPYISNDGYVRMEVNPSDSTGGINSLGLPFERTTETTNNIMVKDGHTLVIAGLFREVSTSGRSQIPFLGSIPVVGALFGNTSDSTVREEVIILLTVHIVEDEQSYAEYSDGVLNDVERMRVGIRNSMQAHGRERLAQSNYQAAMEYYARGDLDRARWHVDLAIHNQPMFLAAIKLKEEMLQDRAWDDEGSSTRMFIHNLMRRKKGLADQHFGRPPQPHGYEADRYPIDECPDDDDKTEPGICGCGVPDVDTDQDGWADCQDGCPSDPAKNQAGACGCGVPDVDSDGDGALDCIDECPLDVAKITPGACGCGVQDTDSDGDGAPNCIDRCPNDPQKFAPGACGCGHLDTDTDGDDVADCIDRCPENPAKSAPGACGCSVADNDTDLDGAPDCIDPCPNDPHKTVPGACGCGTPDTDSDGDGTADCNDGCPQDPNKITPGSSGCGNPESGASTTGTKMNSELNL